MCVLQNAVRYAEAYSRLLSCGRYQLVGQKYAAVMRAAMTHRLRWGGAGLPARRRRHAPPEVTACHLLSGRGLGVCWARFPACVHRRPWCSEDQAARLLAAERKLPPEASIQLALDARADPAADWLAQLEALHAQRQRERLSHRSHQRALHKRGHAAAAASSKARAQARPVHQGGAPAQHAQHERRQRASTAPGVHASKGGPRPARP